MKNKVVLFAGIGRLGIPAAKVLSEKGWKVIISYRKGRSSEKTVKKLEDDSIKGFPAEISNRKEAKRFVSITFEEYKRVDALINIASWYPSEEEDWKRWTQGNKATDNDWKYYWTHLLQFARRWFEDKVYFDWVEISEDELINKLSFNDKGMELTKEPKDSWAGVDVISGWDDNSWDTIRFSRSDKILEWRVLERRWWEWDLAVLAKQWESYPYSVYYIKEEDIVKC